MRDFTVEKYGELCMTLLDAGYQTTTLKGYLTLCADDTAQNIAIMRHDVDRKPLNALKMAKLENELGICSSYYFRYPYTFDVDIIRKIEKMGHEVGYHYEVLSKAKGDYERAIALFEQELAEFRKVCDVSTMGMHGSPLSKYDNRELWRIYDFKDFGILGEAYLSINDVSYFSDTGRSWDRKNKMRDFMPDGRDGSIPVDTTDELMGLIRSKRLERLYILVHPERWASGGVEWGFNYMKDCAFNIGKKVLRMVR